jgi:hypothetical protein
MTNPSILVIALIAGISSVMSAAPAQATGTVRVQQSNGSVQVYDDVSIRVTHKVLRVTTSDGTGTLIIDKAACSYAGQLQVCLPYSVKLQQGGQTRPIDLISGTVYVNTTGQTQQLTYSSTQLPPRGILLALRTKAGTYVNMTGRIDEITK